MSVINHLFIRFGINITELDLLTLIIHQVHLLRFVDCNYHKESIVQLQKHKDCKLRIVISARFCSFRKSYSQSCK